MHKHDRKLNDPKYEEGKQVLRSDSGRERETVWDAVPGRSKYRSQADCSDHPALLVLVYCHRSEGDGVTNVICLCRKINRSHRGTDSDEELRATDTSRCPNIDWKSDMI